MGIGPSTKETTLHHFRDPLLDVVSNDEDIDLIADTFTKFEKGTLEKVTELRQQIMNLNLHQTDTSHLQHIEQLNQELMRNLNIVVENYPELKADTLYSQMMQEIQEQNENISAAISIFNRNVEAFNNQIEVFPNNMINTITLAKKPIHPFRDPIMSQNYRYRPNF